MQKIAAILCIVSSFLFYSCKDNPVTSSESAYRYEWSVVNSSINFLVNRVSTADSATVYMLSDGTAAKVSNGVLSTLNLGAGFYSGELDSYNSGYAVFSGYLNNQSQLKILSDTSISTIQFQDTAYIVDIKIVEPGKILMVSPNKYYIYMEGKLNYYPYTFSGGDNFRNIVKSDNQYYLTTYGNALYKLTGTELTFVEKFERESTYLYSLNNKLIKMVKTFGGMSLSSFNGSSWDVFYIGAYKFPTDILGDDISSMYFAMLGVEGDSFQSGYIFSEGNLVKDSGFPLGFLTIGNMKDNTIYIVSGDFWRETRLYKGRRISN